MHQVRRERGYALVLRRFFAGVERVRERLVRARRRDGESASAHPAAVTGRPLTVRHFVG